MSVSAWTISVYCRGQKKRVGPYITLLIKGCCVCQVNYWPSTVEHTDEVESDRYTLSTQQITGVATKEDLPPVEGGIGDYAQAGDRIRSMDEARYGSLSADWDSGRCLGW